ncbi:hypothetical protein ABZ352_34735 [Streptomyces griseofuscus]|uniref:hypothetical protein n=1 Tax=Streptomyces griseofuscus TaxID=146922 RepID=UPI0033FE4EE0
MGLPLATRLELADSLLLSSERYAAITVTEARRCGASWEEVARAAGLTAAQAGARWDEAALRTLFPAQKFRDRRAAQQRLSDALAYLQIDSAVSVDEAAERTGIDLARLMQILEGSCLPTWPETYTLAGVLGGRAEDVRVLWESACGTVRSPALPTLGATGYLAAALRGLHLSAGLPAVQRLSGEALLSPKCLSEVLAGHHVPPWPATARLVCALKGCVEDFEPLWQAVEQASVELYGSGSSGYMGCASCGRSSRGAL